MTRSFPVSRLVLALCVATLGWAADASAQNSSPLGNCDPKTFKFDPGTGAGKVSDAEGTLTGGPVIVCNGTEIYADEIHWTPTTLYASGDVLVKQVGLRVNADRVELDRQTKLGTFFKAYGTATLTDAPAMDRSMFGSTMEPEVWFNAERIERLGPKSYKLTNGVFSTCVQPNPRWEMRGTSGTVVLDDHASLTNVTLRIKGIPLFYLPYMYYPLKKDDRSTGFLIPTYTASGVRGQGISAAFFWAMSRAMDSTFNYDWFSKAGPGYGAEYRYQSSPDSSGNAKLYVLDEKERLAPDGAVERAAHRSYDFRGDMSQALDRTKNFRLVGSSVYFNDITTQQLYQQNVQYATNRNRKVNFTLTGALFRRRLSVTALAERYDFFTGQLPITRSMLPNVNLKFSDRLPKKIYYSIEGQAAYFESKNPLSVTPIVRVGRFDALTSARAGIGGPATEGWLTTTISGAWRVTQWLESLDPLTGLPVPIPITRSLFDVRVNVDGPKLARVWIPQRGYAGVQHLIEPTVTVRYLSPFTRQSEIIQMDYLDQLVGGTTTVYYGLTNRVKVKKRTASGPGSARELFSVSIGQSYYSNLQASAVDPLYPPGFVGSYSPFDVTANLYFDDHFSGRFQLFINPIAKAPQSWSAYARAIYPYMQFSANWSKTEFLPGVSGFNNINALSHAVGGTATLSTRNKAFEGTYGFNLDIQHDTLIQQRFTISYKAQCCGIAFDYQAFNVSNFQLTGVPKDRRFAVTFTLAGIGSFAPPLGAFGR